MIVSDVFAGKRFFVLGLARSGLATVAALVASRAQVTAWDSSEKARTAVPSTVTLADPMRLDLNGFDAIVMSPGVPLNTHPIAERARIAGIPLIGDIELFAQARPSLPDHKIIAITGTNGKSTTTALIHHILRQAGVPTTLGGNIGLPILGQDPLIPSDATCGVYVLELSSFQIDLTHTLASDVAVLTNITPDHLDRYDGFEDYAASKARLFLMQEPGQFAVIATDDDQTRAIADRLATPLVPPLVLDGAFGATFPVPLLPAGPTVVPVSGADTGTAAAWPALQGPHNAQNIACARAACRLVGVDDDLIEAGLRSYAGLPHRMERVEERDGIVYINDSKATNATSTAPALGSFPRVHWIVGGRRKTDDLDACKPFYGHVIAAYTIGESAAFFETLLLESGVYARNVGTLETAVRQASDVARPGEVVLLSPACASYDQFRDYEARGNAFRVAVSMLGGRS